MSHVEIMALLMIWLAKSDPLLVMALLVIWSAKSYSCNKWVRHLNPFYDSTIFSFNQKLFFFSVRVCVPSIGVSRFVTN